MSLQYYYSLPKEIRDLFQGYEWTLAEIQHYDKDLSEAQACVVLYRAYNRCFPVTIQDIKEEIVNFWINNNLQCEILGKKLLEIRKREEV